MAALDESDEGIGQTAPVWAVFGDLMAGLLGAFVLILVGVLVVQMDLVANLESEIRKRQQEEQRRMALEKALAIPLQTGRVTLQNGRIGISGSVLFALNSDQLQPEGRQLLRSLAAPLAAYLGSSGELLMVSGFTDNQPVRQSNRQFEDNWELSAQRALTVTRALIEAGAEVPYCGTACPRTEWSAPDAEWLAAHGCHVQFRAALEQDVAAMLEVKPDLALGTTPLVQKAKELGTPALYFTNMVSARPLFGVAGAGSLAAIVSAQTKGRERFSRMVSFFDGVGTPNGAGYGFRDKPADPPGFRDRMRKLRAAQAKAEEAVGN